MDLKVTVLFSLVMLGAFADLYKDCQNICTVRYQCERTKTCTKIPKNCMNACRADKATTKERWGGKSGCYSLCQRNWMCERTKKCSTDYEACQYNCLREPSGLEFAKHFQSCFQKGKCYRCNRIPMRGTSCALDSKCLDICARSDGNAEPYFECRKKPSQEYAYCLQEAFDSAFTW